MGNDDRDMIEAARATVAEDVRALEALQAQISALVQNELTANLVAAPGREVDRAAALVRTEQLMLVSHALVRARLDALIAGAQAEALVLAALRGVAPRIPAGSGGPAPRR